MQIVSSVSTGDNLHEKSKPVSGEIEKNISICCLLKILHRGLSVKQKKKKKKKKKKCAPTPSYTHTHTQFYTANLQIISFSDK